MKARLRALLGALPAPVALPLLALIGTLEWPLRPRRRAEAIDHMRLVVRGTAREGELRRLARRSVIHRRGLSYLMWHPQACARARVVNGAVLEDLRRRGDGAIVVHTHLCWITPQVYALAAQGHVDAIVLILDEPLTPLQLLYERVFADWEVETINARGSYERIRDRLREGRVCHIAVDVPGSTPCVLLDKPARLASGTAALAFETGAPIVPAVPVLAGRHLTVRLGEPVRAADFQAPAALTRFLADRASEQILAAPELYHDHEMLQRIFAP